MLSIFDPDADGFGAPQHTGIAGSRFEYFFCPEWASWVVIDRSDGTLQRCADKGEAAARAGMLEAVRRIVDAVADARCD